MDWNKFLFKYFVYYPVVYTRNQNVPGHLSRLKAGQYQPIETIKELQLRRVKDILAYARKNVPYYRNAPAYSKELSSLDDLSGMPSVAKETIKLKASQFVSDEGFRFLTRKTTGGSTGEPVTIWKTPYAMAKELAATWLGYSWAGIDIGDRQARFWGVPFSDKGKKRARLIDFATNRMRCSAFSFTEEDLRNYTQRLMDFRPVYFYGYVSMLREYAEYFRRAGGSTPFDLKCIISTSEVLTEYDRKLLEDTFSTRVYNEYGCGELGTIAHECEKGSLHVIPENSYVEILDGDRPCREAEIGELVITELNNRAMPLIRYRTGDFASFSSGPCSCGRSFPVIKELKGRAYDMVCNREGKLFHGEFFMYIIEEAKRKDLGIAAFQVIQEDYDRFLFRIKPERGYGDRTREFITERVRSGFDPKAVLEFKEVDRIERAPSGKMRLIIGYNPKSPISGF